MGKADADIADEHGAGFDDEVCGFNVAEKNGGGFESDGFGGNEICGEFAGNFGGSDGDRFVPIESILCRDNKEAGGKGAFDLRTGVNGKGAFGIELAEESAAKDCFADEGFGVEDVAFGVNDEVALGAEVARDGASDVIIAQIDMRTAALAHGGLGGGRGDEFGAAIRTSEGPALDFLDGFRRFRIEDILDLEMP